MRSSRLFVLTSVLVAFGCDGCGERPGAETVEASEASETTGQTGEGQNGEGRASATMGPVTTLRGVVRLAEGLEVPSFVPDELGARGRSTEDCSPPKITDRAPLELGEGRGLSNVMVTLTAEDRQTFFSRVPSPEPVRHAITIRDCRLEPRVVAAVPGDVLVLSNEMFYPFLPTTGSNAFLRGLIKDQPQELPVERVGIIPITCGMMAGCGRSDVVVAATRLSAVTGADGAFVIEGVPAGLAVRLHAWHPLLVEGVATVTPTEGQNEAVVIEVRSRPAPATPPEPTPDGPPEESSPLF